MKVGKIPGSKLEKIVLNKIDFKREDVLVHAGIGEDTAVVDLKDELLVISSDPITGAVNNMGYLAVHVACNDLVTSGAEPLGIQVVLLLPETIKEEEIASLMEEISRTAAGLQVEVLGGHTEILSYVSKPIISVTAIGKVARNKYIASSGAKPGDDLLVTKGVGIEGTYILASDYHSILLKHGVKEEVLDEALNYKDRLSVIKEGLIAAELGAHAMHDITEGGLYGALEEIAIASDVGFKINIKQFPISSETSAITRALDIDPAGLISSGSMLIAIQDGQRLIDALEDVGIEAAKVGVVTESDKIVIQNGEEREFYWSNKDELWRLME